MNGVLLSGGSESGGIEPNTRRETTKLSRNKQFVSGAETWGVVENKDRVCWKFIWDSRTPVSNTKDEVGVGVRNWDGTPVPPPSHFRSRRSSGEIKVEKTTIVD